MKKLLAIFLTLMLLAMGLGGALAYAAEDDPATPNADESLVTGNTVYSYTDSGWAEMYSQTNDCVNGLGNDQWSLTLNSSRNLTVRVRDDFIVGDYYGMYVNGTKIGMTPVVPYEGPTLSVGSATVSLLPGVYTITVQDQYFVDAAPYPPVMCPAGFYVSGALAEYTPVEVEIDIKPGSYPNSINLKSKGVIPVAILTTDFFDATTVDGETVMFAGAAPAHDMSDPAVVADHQHDVDGDGDVDFVFHFRTQDTTITSGDPSATLTGETLGGIPISGTDSVRTLHEKP